MRSRIAMAAQAKGANILEIALASAFDDGNNVIRIPEALARPATQAPVRKQRRAICAARIAESACFGDRVDMRSRRRYRDRDGTPALEDMRAECAVSTRAHRTQSRRCTVCAEPQASTSDTGRGRWGHVELSCDQPSRRAWRVRCSSFCSKLRRRDPHAGFALRVQRSAPLELQKYSIFSRWRLDFRLHRSSAPIRGSHREHFLRLRCWRT